MFRSNHNQREPRQRGCEVSAELSTCSCATVQWWTSLSFLARPGSHEGFGSPLGSHPSVLRTRSHVFCALLGSFSPYGTYNYAHRPESPPLGRVLAIMALLPHPSGPWQRILPGRGAVGMHLCPQPCLANISQHQTGHLEEPKVPPWCPDSVSVLQVTVEQKSGDLPGRLGAERAECTGRPVAPVLCSSAMGAQPPNFSWVIPGRLAGLALPRLPEHYQFLREHSVRHLVSLTERKPPYSDSCPDLVLHHLRIPDFCPPSPEQIDRFVQMVDEASARGEVRNGSGEQAVGLEEGCDEAQPAGAVTGVWLTQLTGRAKRVGGQSPGPDPEAAAVGRRKWPKSGTGVYGEGTAPPLSLPFQAVGVHCALGLGRTGTMLACYLVKDRGLAAGDAIAEIRRLRPGSIETYDQEKAVFQFYQRTK
ncbi:Dual specificity protein phosphatase 23 [Galemys pyrenaicus]|uniref:Dual specificity protein phosphatase 23 n=1 Tax=Galemys pyrenaicus TaxID=202257 RepID=A0A8J5ZXN4_GALPY|nr:Dual specificity protein phosphatase 23 [Galemys pyrenaicus]